MRRNWTTSNEAIVCKAKMSHASNDDVIENRHIQGLSRSAKVARQLAIGCTGIGIPAGMVVNEHHGCCPHSEPFAKHHLGIDHCPGLSKKVQSVYDAIVAAYGKESVRAKESLAELEGLREARQQARPLSLTSPCNIKSLCNI